MRRSGGGGRGRDRSGAIWRGAITNFTANGGPEITAGPDGALWFTTGRSSIGRITTAGVVTSYYPGIRRSTGIAAGPDGALWFTDTPTNLIGRITTPSA